MSNMQFLKANKGSLLAVLLLPPFILYWDTAFIACMKSVHQDMPRLKSLLEPIDPFINILSHGLMLLMIALALYAIGKWRHNGLAEVGRSLIIGFCCAGLTVQILKHLIGRARPRLTDDALFIGPTLRSGFDSFPSGHTTVVFCFSFILSRYFPRFRVLFYSLAAIVGFERAEDLSHFPSDILAGAIIGILIGKTLIRLIDARDGKTLPAPIRFLFP
jgi:undecaprenyl-diphosphatase